MLSFFPRGVLDGILNLIESVSEGFSTYSIIMFNHKANSMAEKQVTKSDTNLVFATVDFPSKISLEEVCM